QLRRLVVPGAAGQTRIDLDAETAGRRRMVEPVGYQKETCAHGDRSPARPREPDPVAGRMRLETAGAAGGEPPGAGLSCEKRAKQAAAGGELGFDDPRRTCFPQFGDEDVLRFAVRFDFQ